jgi:hypothetical protein
MMEYGWVSSPFFPAFSFPAVPGIADFQTKCR